MKKWAQFSWRLTGKLHLALLGVPLVLFEFKGVGEAERVLHLGVKWFNIKVFSWSGGTPWLDASRRIGMNVKFG